MINNISVTKNKKPAPPLFKIAFIFAACIILTSVVIKATNIFYKNLLLDVYLRYFLQLFFLYYAIFSFKFYGNNKISFASVMKIGFTVSVIGSLFNFLFKVYLFELFEPYLLESILEVKKYIFLDRFPESNGEIPSYQAFLLTKGFIYSISFIGPIIFGLLTSLVYAIYAKTVK